MNFRVALVLLLLFSLSGYSQPPTDWNAFYQKLDVTAYRGLKFKVQASVRIEAIDSNAEARIWVRIDNADHTKGSYNNMADRPIRNKEWQTYTVEGRVDKMGQYLNFGGLFYHKGIFYYDDFHVYIQNKAGDWDDLDLPESNFESYADIIEQNWHFFNINSPYVHSITTENPAKGNKAMRIDGSLAHVTLPYGKNDSIGKYAIVNGIRIYYEEYGNGEPLLLLHGNRGSIADFSGLIPGLSQQFHVIAVDTRGQGRSYEDGRRYTYELFAQDMAALLDHLQLDSVNILGWSDGGNTGLIMAMKYPKKVKKLATMGANIFIDETVVDPPVIKELQDQLDEIKDDSSFHANNERRLIRLVLTEPRRIFSDLESIQCPVLVMAGEKDAIKQEHTRQIAGHIPHSQLLIFPKGTHYYPEEHPADFIKRVGDFFLVN